MSHLRMACSQAHMEKWPFLLQSSIQTSCQWQTRLTCKGRFPWENGLTLEPGRQQTNLILTNVTTSKDRSHGGARPQHSKINHSKFQTSNIGLSKLSSPRPTVLTGCVRPQVRLNPSRLLWNAEYISDEFTLFQFLGRRCNQLFQARSLK